MHWKPGKEDSQQMEEGQIYRSRDHRYQMRSKDKWIQKIHRNHPFSIASHVVKASDMTRTYVCNSILSEMGT